MSGTSREIINDMCIKTGVFFLSDPKTASIDERFDKKQVGDAAKYAAEFFKENLKALEEKYQEFKVAEAKGLQERVKKINNEYVLIAAKLQYYNDESNRLFRIWSDKTGYPVILTDEMGQFIIYSGGQENEVEKDDVDAIAVEIREAKQRCRNKQKKPPRKLKIVKGAMA